ncbi:MAG: hypothetical protein JXQ69_09360 [Paludibacteraceae bacterium]|nr:hypothetical protein [Paludibacteraceae bacterium]MBN2788513.1 hypothetical protein [Paludibacteraceae bacterium]
MKVIVYVGLLFMCFEFGSCYEGYPSLVEYHFSVKKDTVEKELIQVIKLNTNTIPQKWNEYYTKFDFTDDKCIYFKETPEEILRIGFVGDTIKWEKDSTSNLSLFGWFNGDKWYFSYEIDKVNKNRIIKRFEDSILFKMKYKYIKEEKISNILRDIW